jgi:hypothetical protein
MADAKQGPSPAAPREKLEGKAAPLPSCPTHFPLTLPKPPSPGQICRHGTEDTQPPILNYERELGLTRGKTDEMQNEAIEVGACPAAPLAGDRPS